LEKPVKNFFFHAQKRKGGASRGVPARSRKKTCQGKAQKERSDPQEKKGGGNTPCRRKRWGRKETSNTTKKKRKGSPEGEGAGVKGGKKLKNIREGVQFLHP